MYLFAKKFGFAEQLCKNIKVVNNEPVIEDILREDQPHLLDHRLQRLPRLSGIKLHMRRINTPSIRPH